MSAPSGSSNGSETSSILKAVAELRRLRSGNDPLHCARQQGLPPKELVLDVMQKSINILTDASSVESLEQDTMEVYFKFCALMGEKHAQEMIDSFPLSRACLSLAVETAYVSDPASTNYAEMLLYPGFYALCVYRIANKCYRMNHGIIGRMMSEHAHSVTGIDIHPGATIGCACFIDHGTGIVIGETAVIGNRVKMYHGVLLGAKSNTRGRGDHGKKRHPTVRDDCVIYPNAKILGDIVVKEGCVIGANAYITSDVDPYTTVVYEASQTMRTRTRKEWKDNILSKSIHLSAMHLDTTVDELRLAVLGQCEKKEVQEFVDSLDEDQLLDLRMSVKPQIGPITGINYRQGQPPTAPPSPTLAAEGRSNSAVHSLLLNGCAHCALSSLPGGPAASTASSGLSSPTRQMPTSSTDVSETNVAPCSLDCALDAAPSEHPTSISNTAARDTTNPCALAGDVSNPCALAGDATSSSVLADRTQNPCALTGDIPNTSVLADTAENLCALVDDSASPCALAGDGDASKSDSTSAAEQSNRT